MLSRAVYTRGPESDWKEPDLGILDDRCSPVTAVPLELARRALPST